MAAIGVFAVVALPRIQEAAGDRKSTTARCQPRIETPKNAMVKIASAFPYLVDGFAFRTAGSAEIV